MQRIVFTKKIFLFVLKALGIFYFLNISRVFGVVRKSVHSKLKDKELLEKFYSISNELTCVCGRTVPLNYINDFGHCNAWPMRRVIDGLLKKKWNEKKILHGFVYGFGGIVDKYPEFQLVRDAEYNYLLDKFKNGFGNQILTSSKSKVTPLGLVTISTVLVSGLFLFLKKRKKGLQKEKIDNNNLKLTKEEQEYWNKLD